MRVPEGTKTRTVCQSWGRNPDTRQRVCQQYITSTETIYGTRHGTLTVARVEVDG